MDRIHQFDAPQSPSKLNGIFLLARAHAQGVAKVIGCVVVLVGIVVVSTKIAISRDVGI